MSENKIDSKNWVANYATMMFRFALVRTKNEALAEDLVQDSFLSALKAKETFKGHSSEKTWLFSILRNKIIDHFRKASTQREQHSIDNEDYNIDETFFNAKYQSGLGFWKEHGFLNNPEKASYLIESKEFYNHLEQCLDGLASKAQLAFKLKHLEELETEEICKELEVSTSNYWVLLHRARLSLRKCLSKKELSYDDRM